MDLSIARLFTKNPPFRLNPEDEKGKVITPSWEESRKHAAEFVKWAKVLSGLAEDFTTAYNKMSDHAWEAYRRTPLVDCSFGDSPIGPRKQMFYLKAYLKKLGWPGVSNRDVQVPSIEIEPFDQKMEKDIKWIFKLENEKAD